MISIDNAIRNCPRCRSTLRPLYNGRVELDHCDHCAGNWLDPGKTTHSFGAWAEPSHWLEENVAHKKGKSGMWCPVGHGHLETYDVKYKELEVEIDICPHCSGMWLDPHEGGLLANVVRTYQQKRDAPPGIILYFFQLFTGFPIEVFHPVRRRPWIVYSLIVGCTLVFALQMLLAAGQPEVAEAFNQFFSLVPAEVFHGRNFHAFITYAFLHGGVMHILGNMYFLWIFGDNLEDRVGRIGFLLVYWLAAFAGAGLHALSDMESTIPMLGASGAISGVMGAYLVLFPKVRVWVVLLFVRFQIAIYWYFLVWIGLQVLGVLSGQMGVAWFAHIGGFAAGVALGGLYRWRRNAAPSSPK